MSQNVSVLTGNTKALVEQSIGDYNTVVLAHLYGDFAQHTQVQVHAVPYTEGTGHVVSSHTLRVQMNHPTLGTIAVALPCEPTGATIPTDGPPVFIGQPQPLIEAHSGQNAQFSVYVVSTSTVRYQWQKNGGDLSGETHDLLYLSALQLSDAAIYRCIATNDYGPTVSDNGTLFVASS